MNFGVDVCRFLEVLFAVFLFFVFLCLENKLEIRRILSDKANLGFGI